MSIYPKLPTAPLKGDLEDTYDDYRYRRVLVIDRDLNNEVKKYKASAKQYKTIFNIFQITLVMCAVFEFAIGVSGFGGIIPKQTYNILTTTGGIISLILMLVSNRIGVQVEKHSKKFELARTTKYLLESIISSILTDGVISDLEFKHVVDCIDKYYKSKTMTNINEQIDIKKQLKEAFLDGEQKVREELKKIIA